MQQTGDYINEKKRQSEQLQKLFTVDQAMTGNFPTGTFIVPGRLWVKEGELLAMRIDGKPLSAKPIGKKEGGKPLFIHLFTDILVVSTPKPKGRFKYLMALRLDDLAVQEVHLLSRERESE